DCLWIDMEHQDYDYDQVFNMCLACRASGMEPMVRIRKEGDHSFFRAFEAGATGIMVPHVRTVEEAEWAIRCSRFAPKGLRGMDGVEASARYSLAPMQDYMAWTLSETFVIFQVEDRESLDILDETARMDGLDGFFFGPGDMSQSLGIPGEFDHPRMAEARKRVGDAARQHGKFWGMPVGTGEQARNLHDEEGAQFFACGAAVVLLKTGYQGIRDDFDRVFGD
ncbi:MAG: aldolase/citrate lyase family protein, partial [Candidatus Latescibacteria bacterium]|nr:aldolase/citrate lyase family protein [Candidatus Latescibacterota bacterium]